MNAKTEQAQLLEDLTRFLQTRYPRVGKVEMMMMLSALSCVAGEIIGVTQSTEDEINELVGEFAKSTRDFALRAFQARSNGGSR